MDWRGWGYFNLKSLKLDNIIMPKPYINYPIIYSNDYYVDLPVVEVDNLEMEFLHPDGEIHSQKIFLLDKKGRCFVYGGAPFDGCYYAGDAVDKDQARKVFKSLPISTDYRHSIKKYRIDKKEYD